MKLLQFAEKVREASGGGKTINVVGMMAACIRLHEKHPGVANRWLAELDATHDTSDSSKIDPDIARWVKEING